MTPDLYRTGAALVRQLHEGDLTARFPLSDFLEEHGMPHRGGGLAGRAATDWSIRELRLEEVQNEQGQPISVTAVVIGASFVYTVFRGPKRSAWIGTWPQWAWNGTSMVKYEIDERYQFPEDPN